MERYIDYVLGGMQYFPQYLLITCQGQVTSLLLLIGNPQGGTISSRIIGDLLRSLSLLVTFGICTTESECMRIYHSLTVYRILLRKKLTLELVKEGISLIWCRV